MRDKPIEDITMVGDVPCDVLLQKKRQRRELLQRLYEAAREVVDTEDAAIQYIHMHHRSSHKLTKDAKAATTALETIVNELEDEPEET